LCSHKKEIFISPGDIVSESWKHLKVKNNCDRRLFSYQKGYDKALEFVKKLTPDPIISYRDLFNG
jgi:hypothetical protein